MSDMSNPAEPALPTGGSPESLLRLIADAVPALIAYYELPTLRCQFANQRYAEYNGWTSQSLLGKTVREVIGEAAWAVIGPHVDLVAGGQSVKYVREQTLPDGGVRMIEVNLLPHFDVAGPQVGAFVLITDITEQWRAEQDMRDSEERMRKLAEATNEGLVFHRNGVITDANTALQNLLGYSLPEMLGHQTLEFIPEAWQQTVRDYILAGREDPYEAVVRHKSGREIPVEMVGKTMPFRGETYRIAAVRDISARKEAQVRIEFMARHDPLTQLPNRGYLMEQLGRILAQARRREGRVAVLFVDLDNFKTVNDSLGHHAGDALLCEISRRLTSAVREADLVARLGGDEFLVVLTDVVTRTDAAGVAANLIEAANTSVTIKGRPLTVSASIGISVFPEDGGTPDELIRHADAAMYRAKDGGRNNYQFFVEPSPDSARDAVSRVD